MASSFLRFLDHIQRRTTVGRTPLDEWSARRRDLYLTTHNTHNRQTSLPPVGFEPTIPASERPQTYALDGTVTGTGRTVVHSSLKMIQFFVQVAYEFSFYCNCLGSDSSRKRFHLLYFLRRFSNSLHLKSSFCTCYNGRYLETNFR